MANRGAPNNVFTRYINETDGWHWQLNKYFVNMQVHKYENFIQKIFQPIVKYDTKRDPQTY